MQKVERRRQWGMFGAHPALTAGSLCGVHLFYFQDYRLVGRSVLSVLPHVQVSNLSLFIQYEDRRVCYAVVFGGVNNSVSGDGRLLSVGQYLELGTRRLGHRPGERLIINADGDELGARLFNLVIILSQPGELLCAGASPEAAVEDQHHR